MLDIYRSASKQANALTDGIKFLAKLEWTHKMATDAPVKNSPTQQKKKEKNTRFALWKGAR